ncbi:MAG: TatD family hydrolase [Saprospiraceae bacterium]|nr:TatD family hydrolase [Candidatus Vicinibacter proximus]MCC6844293.1 TatD family hydrolase [Saprospiraceae bacterium]
MRNYWIDTHTHIYLSDFQEDLKEMMDRAVESGLEKILLPNIEADTIDQVVRMKSEYPNHCDIMMGLHPCSVKENYLEELSCIEKALAENSCKGIGEIGLDLYWDKTSIDRQIDAYTIQLKWSRETGLPVSVHTREATEEALSILEKLQDGKITGVFHCFSGTLEQAQRLIQLGFYLGIGGVVTYKKTDLPGLLIKLGLDRIVLETDAPYLSPVPYRGKRNEPAYIPVIGTRIGEILNISLEEVSKITTQNAKAVFYPELVSSKS